MKELLIGVGVSAPDTRSLLDQIVAAEQAGIQCAWMTSALASPDPLAVFAAAALRTQRIHLGTSIIPIFTRHPAALIQGAVVVDDLAPGRLRLGVGPSHRPMMEPIFGIAFERPLHYLREYLTILSAAFGQGKVDFDGERLTAHLQVGAPRQVQVMAGALRTNAFRLCGELSVGAISWMCPLPYLRDVAGPALREGAAQAKRPKPKLVAHIPVAVSTDRAKVYQLARSMFSIYTMLPFYCQMFKDAGFPDAQGGNLSDALIDALVLHGSAEQVKDRLRAVAAFGVDEVLAFPVVAPDDAAGLAATYAALGQLAAA